jgi:CRP-like cAMP-binding protein
MRPVFDHKTIGARYMCDHFVIDFLAAWPWAMLKPELGVLELLRCITLPETITHLLDSLHLLDEPKRLASWGFVQLLLFLVAYLHWTACLWYAVSKDGWFSKAIVDYPILGGIDPYLVSLQAALHLTVGASGLDTVLPTTDSEATVQAGILLLGACIVAGIFGNMASLISDFTADSTEYHRKVSATLAQLKQMHVPVAMQEQSRQYLEYTYQQTRWRPTNVLYEVLSAPLARAIYALSDRDVIKQAYLFSDSTEPFVDALIKNMTRITLQHHDHVLTQGRPGSEMYFLRKGSCEVLVHGQLVNKLEPGCGIGEVAMVLGGRRTSTVRCVGICELSVLTRDSLSRLTAQYPTEVQNVQQYAHAKSGQMKTMNRMTMLMARDKLSEGTKALMTISAGVQRWQYKRKLRQARAKATAVKEVALRDGRTNRLGTKQKDDKVTEELGQQIKGMVQGSVNNIREEQKEKDVVAKEWEQRQKEHEQYTLLMQMAAADGVVDWNEKKILAAARKKYNISNELHETLLRVAMEPFKEVSATAEIARSWERIPCAIEQPCPDEAVDEAVAASIKLIDEMKDEMMNGTKNGGHERPSIGQGTVSSDYYSHSHTTVSEARKQTPIYGAPPEQATSDSSEHPWMLAHVKQLHEKMARESQQELAQVKGQIQGLDAKLDAILAVIRPERGFK